jgi:hypothetical protein
MARRSKVALVLFAACLVLDVACVGLWRVVYFVLAAFGIWLLGFLLLSLLVVAWSRWVSSSSAGRSQSQGRTLGQSPVEKDCSPCRPGPGSFVFQAATGYDNRLSGGYGATAGLQQIEESNDE